MQPSANNLQRALIAAVQSNEKPLSDPHIPKKFPKKEDNQVNQKFHKVHPKTPSTPNEPKKLTGKRKREEPVQQEPSKKQKVAELERSYPPISDVDTIIGGRGAHGKALSFTDDDIVKVYKRFQSGNHSVAKTSDGKVVLQQQATRGCTSACVEMLKADHGKQINWEEMKKTNLGTTETMKRSLEKSGFKVIVSENVAQKKLNDLISKNGSAIIDVNSGCGGHVIILDKLRERTADVRDPYHGWATSLKMSALYKAIGNSTTVIQVQKPAK